MLFDHVELVCYRCSVSFGMTKQLYEMRKQDGLDFWCPNGHKQHFTPEKQKRRSDELERKRVSRLESEVANLRYQNTHLNRRLRVAREKLKKECPECGKMLMDLPGHMRRAHDGNHDES